MRIIVVAPPRTGNLWLKCLLARVYGLKNLPPTGAPARGDAASFGAWAADHFPDGSILHLHYSYSPALAAAMAAVPAHVVTIVRDPYDMLGAIHRAAQQPVGSQAAGRTTPARAALAGKSLNDPDIVDYLATDFRTQLQKSVSWLHSGLATVVRFERLQAEPTAELTALTATLGPVDPDRIRRAVTSCRSTDAATDPSFHDTFDDDSRRSLRDRFGQIVGRLGYEVLEPTDLTEAELAQRNPAAPVGDDDLIPPIEQMRFRYARNVGRDGFVNIGAMMVQRFVDECGLRPEEDVLDVGSGVGRIALGLARFLTPEARYEGFDVDAEGIAWCQENITPRFPNFGFQVADVYNKQYHPEGGQKAAEYRFPYDDASFDFAFLVSVFTHMLPPDMEHYLRELRRVLRPGGRCAITMFVLNETARADIDRGATTRTFPFDHGVYRVQDETFPEHAIAFDETYLRDAFAARGLLIRGPIGYGGWSRRNEAGFGKQDFVVAVRGA